ncbi:MAG: F0F1 ATP synthase subunit epsilon [Chloroflexia bacterium]|nr:F0F1 ATP synthase subunit epsilon [Chloroflexia bacterium]
MAKLTVEIITGESIVYSKENVDLVEAPGADGSLGILPGHAKLVSLLASGEMKIRSEGNEEYFAVFGGFIEVMDNKVIILADSAERAGEIDLERVSQARDSAEAALRDRDEVVDIAEAETALRQAAIRERIGQRRRGSGS